MVLDTSAFIGGLDPFSVHEEQVAPPKVGEEVKRNNLTMLRFRAAVESGKLKIFEPALQFLVQVKACATSVGDSFYLSETDMQVLALALEIKARGDAPQIVTDDYSIQNVATKPRSELLLVINFRYKTCPQLDQVLPRLPQNLPSQLQGDGMLSVRDSTKTQTATRLPSCGLTEESAAKSKVNLPSRRQARVFSSLSESSDPQAPTLNLSFLRL